MWDVVLRNIPRSRCGVNFMDEISISWEEFHILCIRKKCRLIFCVYMYSTDLYTVEYVTMYNKRVRTQLSNGPYEAQIVHISIFTTCVGIVTKPVRVESDRIKAE